MGDSFFFRTVEDELSTIAQYYDAPVLSLRNAVYHLMREQRFGFQVRRGGHALAGWWARCRGWCRGWQVPRAAVHAVLCVPHVACGSTVTSPAGPPNGAACLQWNVSLHFAKGRSAEEMEVLKQAQFFWDENHPWDRTGHRCAAALACLTCLAAWICGWRGRQDVS